MFVWIPLDESGWLGHGVRVAVKLPPETVEELRGTCRGQVDPARPLDERYWLAVPIGATIPDGEVTDLLATSYDEVVRRLPKHNRPVRGGQHGS